LKEHRVFVIEDYFRQLVLNRIGKVTLFEREDYKMFAMSNVPVRNIFLAT